MKLLELLAQLHNWISDKDFVWWPFSFLRPEAAQLMTFRDTALMTLCFGGLTFSFFTIFAIVNNAFTPENAVFTFVSCFVGFFVWFSFITKPLWNIRARELKR